MPLSFVLRYQLQSIIVTQISSSYRVQWRQEEEKAGTADSMSAVKHFHVAGYRSCGFYTRAQSAITGLATLFPAKIVATIKECEEFSSFSLSEEFFYEHSVFSDANSALFSASIVSIGVSIVAINCSMKLLPVDSCRPILISHSISTLSSPPDTPAHSVPIPSFLTSPYLFFFSFLLSSPPLSTRNEDATRNEDVFWFPTFKESLPFRSFPLFSFFFSIFPPSQSPLAMSMSPGCRPSRNPSLLPPSTRHRLSCGCNQVNIVR